MLCLLKVWKDSVMKEGKDELFLHEVTCVHAVGVILVSVGGNCHAFVLVYPAAW